MGSLLYDCRRRIGHGVTYSCELKHLLVVTLVAEGGTVFRVDMKMIEQYLKRISLVGPRCDKIDSNISGSHDLYLIRKQRFKMFLCFARPLKVAQCKL